jgi:hypothetical protein
MAKRELDNSPEAKAKRVRTSRRAHRKGNAFELLCAHKIVDAAGAPFEKKDCYRTPQSGGHRFAGANDLQISGRLLAIFPFGGEMKHRKSFRIEQMFDPTKEIREYHDQVLAALARYKSDSPVFPLLVVRGNGGLIYCASYRDALNRYWDSLPATPGFVYRHGQAIWKMVLLDNLLSALRTKAEVARQVGVLQAA